MQIVYFLWWFSENCNTNFILLVWLSNFKFSQNDIDIGNFEAAVTMQAGNGGEIKGSISSVIIFDDDNDVKVEEEDS